MHRYTQKAILSSLILIDIINVFCQTRKYLKTISKILRNCSWHSVDINLSDIYVIIHYLK